MKNNVLKYFAVLSLAAVFSACSLDQYPHVETTSKDVYVSAANYEAVLAGIYSSLIVNLSDISSDDRFQNYTRSLIMFQEATTDNIDNVWAAGESTTDLNNLCWTASDQWVSAIYYHIYNIVALSNELIRNAADSEIERFSEGDRALIIRYRNEARGLRALAYSHAIDFFPAVSFVDENSGVGSYIPPIYDRKQLFGYVESELKDLQNLLPSSCYGHFTSATASALLARLYLNAEVYTGEARYDECIAACQSVFNAGFSLENDYHKLFNADNHLRTNEIIFSLACDATHTVAWGAGTYLVCATRFDNYVDILKDFGVNAYWNCLRARRELVNKFEDGDSRGEFISCDRIFFDPENTDYYAVAGDDTYMYKDRPVDIAAHDDTSTGYLLSKWSNLTDDGEPASDTSVSGADTDFPMFRLAEVNLIFAEAVLRGGQGASKTDALEKVNDLRRRAYGNETGNITAQQLTLDFILDERARELYTECCRRTDLIRYGKYTSGYNWNWKGGVEDGKDVDSKYKYLPIPEAELSANPSLKPVNTQYGF